MEKKIRKKERNEGRGRRGGDEEKATESSTEDPWQFLIRIYLRSKGKEVGEEKEEGGSREDPEQIFLSISWNNNRKGGGSLQRGFRRFFFKNLIRM